MPQWFSSAAGQVSSADNIRKIVVPKSVRKISVGAFNIFQNVEYMELPFVGTERGNRNDNASTGWQSSFYAIFGSQDYNPMSEYDFMELRSGGTLKTFDELTPNGGTGQIPWYYKLGQSQMPQEYLNVPVHLTEVYITDEYYIADHAFFESPALKKISIQWATTVPTDQFGACGFGAHIFDSSISLETVILPSRMSSYGEGMFNQAISLTTVAIGGKDYETEGDSGDAYRQLKSSIPAAGQVHLPLENVPRAVINSNTFNACRNIVNMVIPHSVVSIMDHAFDGCTAMSDVRSSAGTSVDSSSSKLKNCYLPENLEYIGTLAFRNCSSLQNINVPSNVKTIESMAFNHCTALQSITLPFIGKEAGNGNYDNSIYGNDIHNRHEELLEAMFGYIFGMYGEEGAGNLSDSTDTLVFQAVDGDPSTGRTGGDQTSRGYYYIPASLKNVTITSESVVAVGAFMNCRTIESLTITSFDENPDTGYSNMKIGKGALYGCVNLSNLSIPFVGPNDRQLTKGQVKNGGGAINYQLGYIFGNHSHSDMTEIIQTAALGGTEKYYFPSQLSTVELTHQTYVPSHAFYRVTSLETVIIGQKTKGIQRGIFTGNTNLTNLEVPFIGVGRGPYYNGTGIYFENDHWYGDYWWNDDYRIRNSLIWLFTNGTGNNMYYNEYITSWRHEWDCYVPNAFKNLTITDDYYLDTNAIRGFSSLQSVEIQVGPSVDIAKMHIDSSILYGCSNIRTLKLPFIGKDRNRDSVNSRDYTIGYLFGTTSFGNTYRALQGVGSSATYYIPKTLTTIEFENYMTCIADGAFRGMSSLVSVASPGKDGADIQQLGSYAFDGCTELLFVNIPNASYTYMGNYAFQNCRALTRISEFSPNTVTQIGHGALKGTSIYEVDLKKYYFLGDYAFADCLQISKIDFTDAASQCVDATHRNLEYVGSHLFDGCTILSDVTLLPMNATKQ
ncbi:MAG: leucine-rich repeat domain-containing protein, partial [Anaeroplasmataceae bacterium]|nr:leucine-rich repeat domain-containing protein [Anaeroplasmataceae bacterium]